MNAASRNSGSEVARLRRIPCSTPGCVIGQPRSIRLRIESVGVAMGISHRNTVISVGIVKKCNVIMAPLQNACEATMANDSTRASVGCRQSAEMNRPIGQSGWG